MPVLANISLFRKQKEYVKSKHNKVQNYLSIYYLKAQRIYMLIHENLLSFLDVIRRLLFFKFWPFLRYRFCIRPSKDGGVWWLYPLPEFLEPIFLRECSYNFNSINNTNPTTLPHNMSSQVSMEHIHKHITDILPQMQGKDIWKISYY